MKTVTLDVRDPGEAMNDFVRVWKTAKPEKSARISFSSPDLLWKVLTAKEWMARYADWRRFSPGNPKRHAYELIKAMARQEQQKGKWVIRI